MMFVGSKHWTTKIISIKIWAQRILKANEILQKLVFIQLTATDMDALNIELLHVTSQRHMLVRSVHFERQLGSLHLS